MCRWVIGVERRIEQGERILLEGVSESVVECCEGGVGSAVRRR
jgi:hypothetical protein